MTDAERPTYNGHNADAISVRDYFEARLRDMEIRLQQRFDAQEKGVSTAMIAAEKAVNAALLASEKAVDKAEQAQALRNIVSNEFRNTLSDQAGTFWPIKEGQASLANLSTRFDDALTAVHREYMARADANADRIGFLEKTQSESVGRQKVINFLWGATAIVVTIAINLFIHFNS